MENVVVIGAGQIGQAIARRVGVGKHVVLADRSETNANAAAEVAKRRNRVGDGRALDAGKDRFILRVAFHFEVVLERCHGRVTCTPKGRIGTAACGSMRRPSR